MSPRSIPAATLMAFTLLFVTFAPNLRAEDAPKELALDLGKGIKLELVQIPAGKFDMGTLEKEDGHKKNETRHSVTFTKPFFMGKFEVTQEQYEAVMADNPSKNKGPTLPVERVTWEEASKFCEKLSDKSAKLVQLPTEAQWEYACRAGTTTAYNTGDTITTADANYNGDTKSGSADKGENRDKTMPVGSFKPNAFGVYDMHGNVWEWCRDWYDENAATDAPIENPDVPAKSSEDPPVRSVRGGSFYSWSPEVRSGVRDSLAPTYRNAHGGFRVIVTEK